MLKRIEWIVVSIVRPVEIGFSTAAAAIVILMMFLTTADVIGRYVFNSPIHGAFEVTRVMVVAVVYLGIAYVQSVKGHVKVDALTLWMPESARLVLDVIGYVIALFLMVMITWQSAGVAWEAWVAQDYTMGIVRIPLWIGRSFVPIGTGLFCIQLMADIIIDSTRIRGRTTE